MEKWLKWTQLPIEIQKRMLYEQKLQIGESNPGVFIKFLCSRKKDGGFDWSSTEDGAKFWHYVLVKKNFDTFNYKYHHDSKNVKRNELIDINNELSVIENSTRNLRNKINKLLTD